jgi:hypothetical protein
MYGRMDSSHLPISSSSPTSSFQALIETGLIQFSPSTYLKRDEEEREQKGIGRKRKS